MQINLSVLLWVVIACALSTLALAQDADPKKPPTSQPRKGDEKKMPKPHPALLNPSLAKETAPKTFKVKFATTKGDIVIEAHREWAPKGADRFFNLVKIGYFNDLAFFRVIKGFMAQFGIHGEGKVNAKWRLARIPDDKVKQSNTRGMISFATSGPNSRTTQLFINYGDNARLDGMGFSPFARVVKGIEVVDKLYSGYGEGAPRGRGPAQGSIQTNGNEYLKNNFPKLDYIKTATIME
ncbi:MAG: peptidylprolyl isomerase [Planctomycetota bacterium]